MTEEQEQMLHKRAFLRGYHDALCVMEHAFNEVYCAKLALVEDEICYLDGFKTAFLDMKEVRHG